MGIVKNIMQWPILNKHLFENGLYINYWLLKYLNDSYFLKLKK